MITADNNLNTHTQRSCKLSTDTSSLMCIQRNTHQCCSIRGGSNRARLKMDKTCTRIMTTR